MNISKKFKIALKLNKKPAYQIAMTVGVERVIAVGRILGLQPHECFEDV